ncbi:hypothetical protein, partial [uncultured Bartonella sp.]|uniref:hypothetical protein n=1 Tax=uncultured Bartonella sp. TaxID=104108 RepID=UPI0026311B9D
MLNAVGNEFGRSVRTIFCRHRSALLVAAAWATMFYPQIAKSAQVTLDGTNKVNWNINGITINGKTTNKLAEIVPNATVPNSISTPAASLMGAINKYAATPNDANKADLDNLMGAFNEAAAALKSTNSTAKGVPTIIFNDETTLTATTNTADQRLIVLENKGLLVNIAENVVVTISGNNFRGQGTPQKDCDPANTSRKGCGGALYVDKGAVFIQRGKGKLVFSNNSSTNDGAGLFNFGTSSFDTGTTFIKNVNTTWGGALNNSNNGAVLFGDSANFTENRSLRGGAFRNEGSMLFADNATFDKNTAIQMGGAIYNINGGRIVFGDGTTFTGNSVETTADNGSSIFNGGAIYNDGLVVFNGSSTFDANTTKTDAGAIYNNGTMTFNKYTGFSNNKAAGRGGAIYNSGTMTFNNSVSFSNNSAGDRGGAIYNNSTINIVTSLNDKATQFFGNTDSAGSNSIYFAM